MNRKHFSLSKDLLGFGGYSKSMMLVQTENSYISRQVKKKDTVQVPTEMFLKLHLQQPVVVHRPSCLTSHLRIIIYCSLSKNVPKKIDIN